MDDHAGRPSRSARRSRKHGGSAAETYEELAEEARDLACSLSFAPPAVSAGIDLLLNFARRHDVGRAEALIEEVASSVRSSRRHEVLGLTTGAQALLALGRGHAAIAELNRAVSLAREVGATRAPIMVKDSWA
jgi:hypothetical protein